MRTHKATLELIANDYLEQNAVGNENKPNYSNRDFMNCLIIFQNALMDKMYNCQDFDNMDVDNRLKMAESCGKELHKFIHTYTGLDMHKIENFI